MNSIQPAPNLSNIVHLRQLLREQFPAAHRNVPAMVVERGANPSPVVAERGANPSPSPVALERLGKPSDVDCADPTQQLLSGIEALERVGIRRASITEIVAERLHSGVGLVIAGLIRQAAANAELLALVDGRDCFDPLSVEPEARRRLFWARCQTAGDAIKATDLLLRDGNLPNVALDLQLNDRKEVRALPGSCWYRLRNLVEESGSTLVVLTSCETAPSAHLRVVLDRRFRLSAMDELRRDLERLVKVRVARARTVFEAGRLSA